MTEAPAIISVNNWGYIRFGPVQLYLSETFADTYVELRASGEDKFQVIYRNYKVGTIDAVTKTLVDRTIRKL